MSFFYLSPVKGHIPLHLIEEIVSKRLEFLNATLKGETTGFDEYLLEGSIYDNVGHFMLCLMCTIYDKLSFKSFVFKAETKLLHNRLRDIPVNDLIVFSKMICRIIKKCNVKPLYIRSLEMLCERLMLKICAKHVSDPFHCDDCNKFNIHVNFKTCLPFIANRQVELKKGIAIIPCGIWKQYIVKLFQENLKINLNLPNYYKDCRIIELTQRIITQKYPYIINSNTNYLLSSLVDIQSQYFPPCMKNLHLSLRKNHRLSHDQRFYYTLFLKDIGMPIEEAIHFWRDEYSKSKNGNACCHSWDRDEKKYVYELRHMYGLEGCRKNYSSVRCFKLQEVKNSESGCPFKLFDKNNLKKLLDISDENQMSQIYDCVVNKKYILACKIYHRAIQNGDLKKNCDRFSPVIFYENTYKD